MDADLIAGLDLVAHVNPRSGIVADEDHRQPGPAALCRELSDAVLQWLRSDGHRSSIQDLCRHVVPSWWNRGAAEGGLSVKALVRVRRTVGVVTFSSCAKVE